MPRIQYIIPKLDQNNVIRLKDTAHAAVWVKTNRTQWSNSTVQSSQLSWVGQYKMCVQYDFKFTSIFVVKQN